MQSTVCTPHTCKNVGVNVFQDPKLSGTTSLTFKVHEKSQRTAEVKASATIKVLETNFIRPQDKMACTDANVCFRYFKSCGSFHLPHSPRSEFMSKLFDKPPKMTKNINK